MVRTLCPANGDDNVSVPGGFFFFFFFFFLINAWGEIVQILPTGCAIVRMHVHVEILFSNVCQ